MIHFEELVSATLVALVSVYLLSAVSLQVEARRRHQENADALEELLDDTIDDPDTRAAASSFFSTLASSFADKLAGQGMVDVASSAATRYVEIKNKIEDMEREHEDKRSCPDVCDCVYEKLCHKPICPDLPPIESKLCANPPTCAPFCEMETYPVHWGMNKTHSAKLRSYLYDHEDHDLVKDLRKLLNAAETVAHYFIGREPDYPRPVGVQPFWGTGGWVFPPKKSTKRLYRQPITDPPRRRLVELPSLPIKTSTSGGRKHWGQSPFDPPGPPRPLGGIWLPGYPRGGKANPVKQAYDVGLTITGMLLNEATSKKLWEKCNCKGERCPAIDLANCEGRCPNNPHCGYNQCRCRPRDNVLPIIED